MSEQTIALHWLMVGYISLGAKEWIEDQRGQVREVSSEPRLYAVGFPFNPNGTWVWSKGRQEYRHGVEYWSTGELQEASTGITLRYGNSADTSTLAEYCSAHTNYLILPDEEYDATSDQVKERGAYVTPVAAPVVTNGELDDLDEHPF
jgi:hypothetical protein